MEMVQVAAAATSMLVTVTSPLPATAVTVGAPQLAVVNPLGAPTIILAGKVSVNASPFCVTAPVPVLAMLNVSVVF